ncbi:hypothetical protein FGG08_003892 [Glutinoglossum americanum]|uniref:Uncharacterized protein n=1 Tax=Glutinoglossum americanum TaxID=1670608 RepID=A0A9P8I3G1_9PEZI|nr:hypothetical protein FGG08_003892 [Glutinoglossum americanum]
MSWDASSNAWSTREELFTPAEGSAITEQGDVPQPSPSFQDSPGEFIGGYGGQAYLGMSADSLGLRSSTSTSLTAVGGQFSDGQPAGHAGSSRLLRLDTPIESNAYTQTDLGAPLYDMTVHQMFDQFAGPKQPRRRRSSTHQRERNNRPSRRTSYEAPSMSIGLSHDSSSTTNTRHSGAGRRRGPLTQEQRQNAKAVRGVGACWRCHSLNAKVNIPFQILSPLS